MRSVADLKVLLGSDLKGLGVNSVQHLCSSRNMDRRLLDLGPLILLNLHFLSHVKFAATRSSGAGAGGGVGEIAETVAAGGGGGGGGRGVVVEEEC